MQTAAVLVVSPIIEADLPAGQYAYRSKRSAHDAVKAVHGLVNRGHTQVIDADLSGYFDTIPHAELMKCVRASHLGRAHAVSDQDVADRAD